MQLYRESLQLDEKAADLQGQAASLHQLASIESDQGNPAEARRLLQRSLGIAEGLGDLRGQAASLHQLAIIESAQGNPAEARRLLQRSLGIEEGLGDLQGQAASLHVLASIESDQGNPAEARRLWECSIALDDQVGNVDGRATTLVMLAQLEADEGNLMTAFAMARESVRLLEGIGSAKAAMAREILADLEARPAGGAGGAPPLLAELSELLERAKAAGPEEGLAVIDAALDQARRESVPPREVVAVLARSVMCWNAGDVTGCDESLRRTEELLDRVAEAERPSLAELVGQFKAQRATATATGPSESDRLYAEALAKAQAGDMAGAQGLFEASLAASRRRATRGVAINLLSIGQALLALGRVDEARDRLREGLEVASDLGDEGVLQAMQEVATVVAAMVERAPADTSARRSDEKRGETEGSDDVPDR